MLIRFLCFFLLGGLVACEPYDLARKPFPVCVKPAASIGYVATGLDVTFFVDNPTGDIGSAGWDPGDGRGRTPVGARVTYHYNRPGTYTLTLNLVNACDDRFSTTRQIIIQN